MQADRDTRRRTVATVAAGMRRRLEVPSIDGLTGTSAAMIYFQVGCNSVIRAFFNGYTAAIDVNLCVQDDSYPHATSC